MNELESKYDVTPRELARGRRLKVGAIAAPLALAGVPAALFLTLFLIFGVGAPPAAVTIFFFGSLFTVVGFISGLIVSGMLGYKYSNWSVEMRERIAADGIRAEEIGWFKNELKSHEKLALKSIEASNVMLADAFRETLASRLTATRIIKSSKRELLLTKRRQSKVKYLKSYNSKEFQTQIERDVAKISDINDEAKLMLVEAETRLQMIEAAAARGGNLADSERALKKLSARSKSLPLALEEAKMAEEIRLELEREPLDS